MLCSIVVGYQCFRGSPWRWRQHGPPTWLSYCNSTWHYNLEELSLNNILIQPSCYNC